MRFEWDETKNETNIRDHRIDFADVPSVMNDKDLKRHSRTDRTALEAMTDEEIDYSDVPPLDAHFFDRAILRLPEQQEVIVTMQVDPDVFAWFDAQKDGWERRMRAALRIYVEAHKEQEAAQAA